MKHVNDTIWITDCDECLHRDVCKHVEAVAEFVRGASMYSDWAFTELRCKHISYAVYPESEKVEEPPKTKVLCDTCISCSSVTHTCLCGHDKFNTPKPTAYCHDYIKRPHCN